MTADTLQNGHCERQGAWKTSGATRGPEVVAPQHFLTAPACVMMYSGRLRPGSLATSIRAPWRGWGYEKAISAAV